MTATKTETEMAARLAQLEPGTKRHEVLSCAIDFKRSWFRLAHHLVEVRDSEVFAEWGWRSFESYAQSELHIRRDSVQKLVRSFDFLQSHERPTLRALQESEAEGNVVALPSYQAIDILAEARQNPYLSDEDYRALRDQVFREDPPPTQLRKTLKERAPEPPKPPEESSVRLRRCLQMAERLYGLLMEEDVPEAVTRSMEQTVGGLRRLLDE